MLFNASILNSVVLNWTEFAPVINSIPSFGIDKFASSSLQNLLSFWPIFKNSLQYVAKNFETF